MVERLILQGAMLHANGEERALSSLRVALGRGNCRDELLEACEFGACRLNYAPRVFGRGSEARRHVFSHGDHRSWMR